MYVGLHVKCRYSCQILKIFYFLERFSKNSQISNLMKIRPVQPSCSMWTDRRTDVTKLIVDFGNFARAPKNRVYFPCLKATCYMINSLLPFFLILWLSSPVLVVTGFSTHLPGRANTACEPSKKNIWYFSLPHL